MAMLDASEREMIPIHLQLGIAKTSGTCSYLESSELVADLELVCIILPMSREGGTSRYPLLPFRVDWCTYGRLYDLASGVQ